MTRCGRCASIIRIASSALLATRQLWPSKARKCSNAFATDWSSSTTRMSAMGLVQRQPQRRPGALRRARGQLDPAAVALDHGARVHEAEADAVALGRNERIE